MRIFRRSIYAVPVGKAERKNLSITAELSMAGSSDGETNIVLIDEFDKVNPVFYRNFRPTILYKCLGFKNLPKF